MDLALKYRRRSVHSGYSLCSYGWVLYRYEPKPRLRWDWRKCLQDRRKDSDQDHYAGSRVYFFDIWVGDLAGQDAILGIDFMVPAGIRLDMAYGSISLPDEVRIQLSGRRQLYSDKARLVTVGEHIHIEIGQSVELQLHPRMSDHKKFWVTRGDRWVPTMTNVSDKVIILQEDVRVGIWLAGDHIPRTPGFVSVGSRRYMECQNLALEASVERGSEQTEVLMESTEPMVDRPSYPAPHAILKRPEISQIQVNPASRTRDQSLTEVDLSHPAPNQIVKIKATSQGTDHGGSKGGGPGSSYIGGSAGGDLPDPELEPDVHHHEGNDLYAEDVDQEMATLPEINPTTDEVKIEDVQVGDPEIQTTADIERLRPKIWKYRHLLIGKGNALPPATRGVVCDIDMSGAKPIAQRVRKFASRFREKLSDLTVGLLSPKMTNYSRSLWVSPIVVIVKKDGINIILCIDHRLVNSLTQQMVYPMTLINDLLEDLDKILWYCSIDMVSGFWVVTMTDRARAILAFITPFGLFEWNRILFGLRNALQINQRLIDNALYGFTRIPPLRSDPRSTDVFEVGEADDPGKPSVIGRRSYIDDIHIPADSWDQLCDRVDALLEVCDKWNMSISVVKGFWGMRKEEYLGHRVSNEGLEANPKALNALTDLVFPELLRPMQSFQGSLNYYSRFIEGYSIYAAVLYELREVDIAVMSKKESNRRSRPASDPQSLREEVVRDLRIDRIRQAQDEEARISGLKKYLNGDPHDMAQQDAKSYANRAADYEVDHHDLPFNCPSAKPTDADRDKLMRLAIPETLYLDILHHYQVSLEGGHPGIGRTYQRIRDHFHWRGLYKSVQKYVVDCVDRETGESKPRIIGESPDNLQASYPSQTIAMDHIPSLSRSHKGNTELLIFEDLFSGYVIAKVSSSRTAQTVAESYEEFIFRRFGASEAIRHVREPEIMSDFFRTFNKILGQRQRVTMAYRPQANGSAKRMVQTTTRAIKMYVQDLDQRDWDEYAERITFAINTANDRIRGETPFYVVHGWDPRSTLEAVIPEVHEGMIGIHNDGDIGPSDIIK
ncbi:LOW QUALITY PROTEIN: reverse transcriptase [Phytophthora palmivora]|uniref:Reverse transcriptase n=1 Tax=Phytophthora palmivora TaxID=4796 RepID=A0A2P4XAJ7_9STRA|nr:LOW QUALITY PROTEIN: reverse transcriptase [Phytophthora palmivora]